MRNTMVSPSKGLLKKVQILEKERSLYESYKNIVGNLNEGIWIGKMKNKTIYTLCWNKGAEKISGFQKKQLKANIALKIVPGLKHVLEKEAKNPNGRKRRINIERYEYNYSKNTKHPLYLNIRAQLLAKGKMIVIIFEDLTEKARMEKDIIQQNRELSALNQIGIAINQTLDLDRLLNSSLEKILEVMNCEGGGIYIRESKKSKDLVLKVTKGLSSDFHNRFKKIRLGVGLMGKGLAKHEAVILESVTRKTKLTKYVAPEGMKLAVSVPIRVKNRLIGALNVGSWSYGYFEPWKFELLLTIGNQIGIVIENAMLMDSLKKHEQDLQRLSSKILRAQEEERKRISRELHDEASQALIAAKINLEMLKKRLPPNPEEVSTRLAETSSLLVHTLENLRRLSHDLRPSMLDDLGLVPTLRWYTERYAKRLGISINLYVAALDKRLDLEIETTIYRIIQEALTNIAKYAHAKEVTISLEKKDSRLITKVEDNGRGFKLEKSVSGENRYHGSGIVGMKERVHNLGGNFYIKSSQGRGTKLLVEIPLNR